MLKTQIITLFQDNYKFLPQGPKEGWRGTWAFLGCLLLGQAEGDPSVQFNCSVMSTLCDPMDCRMPGISVHHQLLELTQTHVHRVSDAIQPPQPLLSPSSAFNLSQHQGLFQWVSSSHQVAKGLEHQFQHQSVLPMSNQDCFLQDLLVGSPRSPRDSQESSTPEFKSINSSALSFLYSPTLTSIHDY